MRMLQRALQIQSLMPYEGKLTPKRQRQHCKNAVMMLVTIELLQNELQPYSEATPL